MTSADELHVELTKIAVAEEFLDNAIAPELAHLAIRRWRSFDRRNKTRRPTVDLRIRDLAKGLLQSYPGDLLWVVPGTLEDLAREFGEVLSRED